MNEPRTGANPIVFPTETPALPDLAKIRRPLAHVPSKTAEDRLQRAEEDAVLVAALATDEVGALEQLYDRYSALVFSVALRVLHDHALAEDVTQEVFLRIWRQPASFDPSRGRFISWISSVSRNRALDEQRRMSRRRRAEDQDEDPVLRLPAEGRGDDPAHEAVLADDRRRIYAAMLDLPEAQRLVIELAYFGGLTQTEIAERTGDPLGTIKTRIRLGMRKLREALTDDVEQRPGGSDDSGGA
ncbi:MAG: sigma-70 family RNA polymerase sigma factor [Chloroflexi bacterium]|nr:sigma-70 family RNA polymerase sigma factor [Chloroflexota bacterium]MDA1145090.1 sigma-70 family RNA polymerase sigma factor [Chloroflexota bacterium]